MTDTSPPPAAAPPPPAAPHPADRPAPAAWAAYIASADPAAESLSVTPEGVPVPAFTPFVPQRRRLLGWSPVTHRAFIAELTRIGSARAAAAAVGRSVRSAYLLKRKFGAESFAAAWGAALIAGREGAQQAAISRALHGEMVPVFKDGRCTGYRVKRNDRLLVATLGAGMAQRIGREAKASLEDYRYQLEQWEVALNRRTMRLEAGGKFPEEREAEIWDAHVAYEQEAAAEKKRAYRRDIRARLRRAEKRARVAPPGPSVRML